MSSPDGLSRGVPVQDLPENQDPAVRYTLDEVVRTVTPWPEPATERPAAKKAAKKAPAKKASASAELELGEPAPADDEEHGDAGAEASEKAAVITSVRETGS